MDFGSVVILLVKVLLFILVLCLIGAIINIILDKIKGKESQNIFKKRDISNSDMDILLNSLKRIKGYSKIITNQNNLIRINEYGIDAILVCNYYGILKGNQDDKNLYLKSDNRSEAVINPIIDFNEKIEKLKDKIGIKDINKYILLGGNTLLDVQFKDIKVIRRNEAYYVLSTNKDKKKYTKQEIDELYKKINM